ncbi:metal ABC transporter ATP-binding protein [Saccharibacillus sp. CPCC 101409]|uniref:metal ABC transporter ATP-binding protein n=1 Tax=Saccharibacillus sp. CPCC 101409 TaxID=3058041 RepID=UPI0026719441|nr:metal ABC transporter ATP-binding protein [Saccharibacillus sp. CPCC 101409]MDO3409521.1 metal ABC transporter ATP-binding protein [Saccharibacillus sp. CPCC 101409]
MSVMPANDCHQPMIELRDVSFSYKDQHVLQNLSFSFKERDFVGIVGSNGAGKTTLLKMLVGLMPPTSGEITLFGQPIKRFRDWERIGYVPQKNALNMLFPATVREVVTSGLFTNKSLFRRLGREAKSKLDDALQVMRIEDIADKRIGRLSGGQQQRVFLARAMINRPELLILDEPTVGIDAETQDGFFELIRHMHQHHNITFLMVSHDIDRIEDYLGKEPRQQNGKIKFFVRHSHDDLNCGQTDLQHSMPLVHSAE